MDLILLQPGNADVFGTDKGSASVAWMQAEGRNPGS